MAEIRVRIAPSPTGYFHVGTARTALFNWLFAQKHNGKFILRIEDTDLERSSPKYSQDITESLRWLGLNWDEGPYYQSERAGVYEKYIKQLLENNFAYYCFCPKEELETQRQAQLAQGLPPQYTGKCKNLSASEVINKLKNKEPCVIRFKTPQTKISIKDIIRDDIEFDAGLIGDIVIAKNEKTPLYNLAVVIDDAEMEISHIIRGEDHINNTPKQIVLQEALGFKRLKYAHLPLILDSERGKMSKRHASTAIKEYMENGYLPETMINFLALLGWHPKDDQEILSLNEITEKFELERVQKGGAVFNIDKLNWLNSQYIKNMPNEELAERIKIEPKKKNLKIIAVVKERMQKLTDFPGLTDFFYKLPDYPASLLIWKDAPKEKILENLRALRDLEKDLKESKIMALAEVRGRGEVLWPMRVALSGKEASPGPLEVLSVLGIKESLKRIEAAIEKLSR